MTNILVHTPAEVAANGAKYLARRQSGETYGIPLGLAALDKPVPNHPDNEFFVPVWPGEMVTVIGRPGNGKTGLMMWWARTWAKILQGRSDPNRLVVYITYEQTIEELDSFQMAAETHLSMTDFALGQVDDAGLEKVKAARARRAELPLWFMGHSYERRSGQKRPQMTVDVIEQSLRDIQAWSEDSHREIDMVFVDYLQRMPFAGRTESKAIGHANQLDGLKEIAMSLGTRLVVGVQAGRDVDSRDIPIPTQDDGQWTSNIEQASDGILTVCRPRKYRQEDEPFGSQMVKGFDQMILTVAKRKMGADNFARWIRFNPIYNQADSLEEKYYKIRQENGQDD